MKIEKWRLWAFLGLVLYYMVAMYGYGIQRGEQECIQEYENLISIYEKRQDATRKLVDSLLIESGRDPIWHSKESFEKMYKEELQKDLLLKENQLDA